MTAIGAESAFEVPKGAEADGNGNFLIRHWKGIGATSLALALLGGAAYAGTEYQAGRDRSQIAQVNREKSVALALTAAGFPNVVSVEEKDGRMVAGLTDENCDEPVSFLVEGPNDEGAVRVVMPQRDVEGKEYGTATAMNGTQATEVLRDICS